jgi:type I restriction enzyme S subunit
MKWETKPLREVMRHRKGSITIEDATSYKLCRVQLHRRGVVLRQNLRGAEIRTKKQQVCKAGDFLVAEMDAKVGGYGFVPPELDGAIVSSHYYLFELDSSKLHAPFLEAVSQTQILQQQIVPKGSTNYSSIRPDSVLDWQIPLPSLDVQKRVARNFQTIQSKLELVGNEIARQQSLLTKLKQAILQEAIQGKLTADWRAAHPDVEPASQLLHRIQAEKARLIAAKKVKSGTRQDAIDDEGKALAIPNEWERPHLDDITMLVTDGTHQTPTYTPSGRIFLSAQNVKPFRFMPEQHKFVSEKAFAEYTNNRKAERGDLLLGRVGAGIGETAVIDRDMEFAFYVSLGLVKTLKEHTIPQYLAIVFNSPYGVRYARGNTSSKGGSAGNFNLGRIRSFLIPLPPLAEQAAIVERVEALMTTCRALEAEIGQTRRHADQLLQAVLKEAFAPALTAT